MKIKITTIYDSATKGYTTPKFALTNAAAIRTFSDEVNDKSTFISKHPHDFALFAVGEFDALTGEIIPYKAPESLGLATNYVQLDN